MLDYSNRIGKLGILKTNKKSLSSMVTFGIRLTKCTEFNTWDRVFPVNRIDFLPGIWIPLMLWKWVYAGVRATLGLRILGIPVLHCKIFSSEETFLVSETWSNIFPLIFFSLCLRLYYACLRRRQYGMETFEMRIYWLKIKILSTAYIAIEGVKRQRGINNIE